MGLEKNSHKMQLFSGKGLEIATNTAVEQKLKMVDFIIYLGIKNGQQKNMILKEHFKHITVYVVNLPS